MSPIPSKRCANPTQSLPRIISRRTYLALFTCCAVLFLGGCGKKPPPLAELPSDAVVLAFGDSLTFGTGAATDSAYPAQLGKLIGRKVVGMGVPGEVSEAGLQRLPQALDEVKPKLLILCHGGNDFLQKRSEADAAANVRSMVSLAKSRGIAVMLIATPKPGLAVAPPDFYAQIAKEFDLPIELDVLREVLTDRSLKSDLVHPNAAGYRVIAEAVAKTLKKAGAV
jgi:acyl-CoA thioesterase I